MGTGLFSARLEFRFEGALTVLALEAIEDVLALADEVLERFADDHGIDGTVEVAVDAGHHFADEGHELREFEPPVVADDGSGEEVERLRRHLLADAGILGEGGELDLEPGEEAVDAIGVGDGAEGGCLAEVDAAFVADVDDLCEMVGAVGGEELRGGGIAALEGEGVGMGGGGEKAVRSRGRE